MSPRWRLILASAALLGWLSYLGYAALTKSHGPIVSHAQAAAAASVVVAEVVLDPAGRPDSRVKVVETRKEGSPAAGSEITVANLTEASGFTGPGRYLLYLTQPDVAVVRVGPDGAPVQSFAYSIVGQQRSPGNDLAGVGKPLIYAWNEDVRKQDEKLRR